MNNSGDKVVFITGATIGIGRATAQLLAEQGHKVIVSGRNPEMTAKLIQEFAEMKLPLEAYSLEVTDKDEFKAVIDDIVRKFGRIDTLVNNAGIMPLSFLEELKIEEWDKTIEVNVKGVLYGIAAVIPHMKRQGRGHIVNLASIAGSSVMPSTAVYSASKAAVISLTEGIRQEFKGVIRATAICPGVVKTGLARSITNLSVKNSVEKMQDNGLTAENIAQSIAYVINLPESVSVNELVIRHSSN